MTTAATFSPTAQFAPNELYDDDECIPRNSPLLQPRTRVHLTPSPPPPSSPGSQLSSRTSSSSHGKHTRRRRGARIDPSQGDAVVVSLMGGGNQPEVATHAGQHLLTSEYSENDSRSAHSEDEVESTAWSKSEAHREQRRREYSRGSSMSLDQESPPVGETSLSPAMKAMFGPEVHGQARADGPPAHAGPGPKPAEDVVLKTYALGALTLASPESETDASGRTPTNGDPQPSDTPRRQESVGASIAPAHQNLAVRGARHSQHAPAPLGLNPPYSPPSLYSPQSAISVSHTDRSEPRSPPPLPPIQSPGEPATSPRSDGGLGSNSLPSIREQFGDLPRLPDPGYAQSPPASATFRGHGSPPVSPEFPQQSSFYQSLNGGPPAGYALSTARLSHAEPSPAGPHDRISIDSLSNQGTYVCKVPGCSAPAFQTQYLLNSHANVHSQERPHYCPVKGCPRSEGGKGFKRKNEMIRHGLVHDSPGYVCPFCPDREHKYPRPDNLQRHVRVHHVDKDKDDPALRDVLAQRPDGPNRGRRRRGVAT
ncbi:uncharacterized protein E0L32_007238 [Thyridium curvatum]|uniref:C2H2-type domain-containing protein n=1 Tax=Thyridium curvatum TaxID=1093900 RepID=A0A507AWM0_9PEZI|nr:uncharacterized protein E0L32_007238 [Thyridium curvatum]TPX12123.1 hypothetical protein E0L32_007238 [Thyridium curvatum]